MTDRIARLSAFTVAFLAVACLAVLYVTSHPGLKGTEAQAEFEDAYPLLPGMHVRVSGAIAGTTRDVELTDHGTALVTMQLNEGTEPPRQDASAAIRQQDITGDSYVALSLGDDPKLLGEKVIPPGRTLTAPRLDDLLNSFDTPVREGLRLIFVELGKAFDGRGDDLNRAALRLRPALEAADQATAELASQNHVLRRLITDAERVTSQAADRHKELAGLIDGLARTTNATAAHSAGLDSGLDIAPETVVQARGTLARLRHLATAARPLAVSLNAAAPDLAENARLLTPFVADANVALRTLGPSLRLTRKVLRAAEPTLRAASGSRPLTGPFDLAAGIGQLLTALLGEEQFIKSLFGANGYGVGAESEDDVGLGAPAVELGTQTGYEGNDPDRRFLRAVAVPTCEMFGVPIGPGCLNPILGGAPFPRRSAERGGRGEARTPTRGPAPAPGAGGPEDDGKGPDLPGLPEVPPPQVQLPPDVQNLLDLLLGP